MASEQSDRALIHWQRASATFDYYLTGLTAAILAFSAETYSPSAGSLWLVVPGWSLLTISLFAGLSRLEKWVTHLRHGAEMSRARRPEVQDKIEKLDEELVGEAETSYRVRRWTFVFGFVLLGLAKIMVVTGWWDALSLPVT